MSVVSTYPLRRTRDGQVTKCVLYASEGPGQQSSRSDASHPGVTLVKLRDECGSSLAPAARRSGGGLHVVAGRRASHLPSSDQPVDGAPTGNNSCEIRYCTGSSRSQGR